ncbi:Hypothetical predicted protein [Mytilus galloprovincialis]|uniref:Uncharacterized protein n=1 Tax=Mytilus galloprovincialis TaxID=29158 RepID=A0A8B6CTK3_MYTGA|nr:Hypothetical predicted protein [Mytilus galloprovincialis]
MDHEGNREKIYGEDNTNDISFTCPWKITVTYNDNMYVADVRNNKMEGSVVVLGHDNIINTYLGHPLVNIENLQLTPSDLTTTSADNVIVVDMNTCTLHILDYSGERLTYISTKDRGIVQNPFSIGLATAGQFNMLYIGTTLKEGRKDKAKLYKLNFRDC